MQPAPPGSAAASTSPASWMPPPKRSGASARSPQAASTPPRVRRRHVRSPSSSLLLPTYWQVLLKNIYPGWRLSRGLLTGALETVVCAAARAGKGEGCAAATAGGGRIVFSFCYRHGWHGGCMGSIYCCSTHTHTDKIVTSCLCTVPTLRVIAPCLDSWYAGGA